MLKYNFTVGPSKLYPGVTDFITRSLQEGLGELSHRSPQFSILSENTLTSFRSFFQIPDDYHIYYLSSATEGMEVVLRSGVTTKSCHVVNGNFGELWSKQAQRAQKEVQVLTNGEQRVPLDAIVPDADAELLAITANETASGISYSPEDLAKIRHRYPECLLAVDVTSSMGAVAYDFRSADAWFFSVQKALGMPAGLGLLVVSPRFFEKAHLREAEGHDVGAHHSLPGLHKKMVGKYQTPTTPNVLSIATLGFLADSLQKEYGDIVSLYQYTSAKAQKLYAFFEAHPSLSPAVQEGRSETTIVVDGSEDYLQDLHARLATKDIVVGKGYGLKKTTQLRIANFPVHREEDMQVLLDALHF